MMKFRLCLNLRRLLKHSGKKLPLFFRQDYTIKNINKDKQYLIYSQFDNRRQEQKLCVKYMSIAEPPLHGVNTTTLNQRRTTAIWRKIPPHASKEISQHRRTTAEA
uniref:Uncharacterized protein n=1 Tax=Bombyx mori TaxID=7091 RepID=A0A8R2M0J5_BOMMO|nr:uncharacterized protein LOC119629502 [Bombyx mori]